MALSPRLELRTSQSLVMTPQLMQAIKLLQLSTADLVAYVEAELERNPLLEKVETNDAPASQEAFEGEAERPSSGDDAEAGDWAEDRGAARAEGGEGEFEPAAPGEAEAGDWLDQKLEARTEIEGRLDTDLDNVFPDDRPAPATPEPRDTTDWSNVGSGGRDGEGGDVEDYVAARPTLADHLSEQLALAVHDPAARLIGAYLIDLVDESGYITGPLAEVAEKLGTTEEAVEAVLKVLQGFDPPGICARNLAECLAAQLVEQNRFDPAMRALIDNLDLLARRDIAALRRLCGVDEEDLADMIAEIRRLNPRPGRAFDSATIQTVAPDVIVRAGPDGNWIVELNSDTLPNVLVNQTYYAEVSRVVRDEKEKSFLSECLQTATWLTRSLDQRARTILKVATEIVRQQDAFLVGGINYLRPLNLKTVADAIGMHESTVSRVTSNKYIATPRGLFELKYFFTSAIASAAGGEAHSAEAVRHRIKTLIDAETASGVLSDDTIVAMLRAAGVDIARRTVAKYRESMRIPSSVQRRRELLSHVREA